MTNKAFTQSTAMALLLMALVPLSATAMAATGGVLPSPAPAPSPAPSRVQGPPDGLIPPAPGGARPAPPPIILPAPAPRPQPTPAPAPAPAPAPVTAGGTAAPTIPTQRNAPPAQTPRVPQRPAVVRAPAAGVAATGTPQAPPPSLPDPNGPVSSDDPVTASPVTVPAADPTADVPVAETAPLADSVPDLPGWLWPLGGALLLGGAGWWLWTRQRRTALADGLREEAASTPTPTPASPAPTAPNARTATSPAQDAVPAAPPVAAPPAPAKRPVVPSRAALAAGQRRIACSLTPVSASATLVNLRLRYALELANVDEAAIQDLRVRVAMFTGPSTNPQSIEGWFVAEGEPVSHHIAEIAPDGRSRIEAEFALPLANLQPMTIGGKPMLVPLIGVAVDFRHARGAGRTGRAFVCGIAREGADKLLPLRLDGGPGAFAPLAARDTGIAIDA